MVWEGECEENDDGPHRGGSVATKRPSWSGERYERQRGPGDGRGVVGGGDNDLLGGVGRSRHRESVYLPKVPTKQGPEVRVQVDE